MHTNTHLKALALQLSNLSTTRIIHGAITKNPFSDDAFYTTKLVRMYAVDGDLVSARNLFDQKPNRTIYLWNSIIRAYAQAHKFCETFTLFNHLLRSEIQPDNYTLACISRAFSDSFHTPGLRFVHGKVVTYGYRFDLVCNTALVSSYSKLGLIDEASQVFCRIDSPDLVLWNAMISAYVSSGDFGKGFQMFHLLQNKGMRPDGYTVVGLITGLDDHKLPKTTGETVHGFCIKCGLDLNDHVGSVLVSYYSRCNSMDSSCRVFDSLTQPDLVSRSALITGFSQAGDYQMALCFFSEMLMNGGRPDSVLLASVLSASAQLAFIGPGSEIHCYAIRNHYITDIAVSSALIDMYVKCGFLEIGINVFKIMPRRNIVTYNSIVSGLGLYGRSAEAFRLFEEVLEIGLEPDETTFSGLLCACCHAGLVSDGREYFRKMIYDFRIGAKTEHYVYMVKLLGGNGYLEEAYNLIKSLPGEVDSSIWGALLTCCELNKDYELTEVIAEHLLENKSTYCSRYRVMLSNLYAGDRRWDDVERLRVDAGGAKGKMPGISRTGV